MYLYTIDIAHPSVSSDEAEEILSDETKHVRFSKEWRVLKVVHGKGTIESPSALKQIVRNWVFRNRGLLRGVISGEDYHMFNPVTQEMRKICGQHQTPILVLLILV